MPRTIPLHWILLAALTPAIAVAQTPGTLDPLFNPTDAGYALHDGVRTGNGVNGQQLEHAVRMSDGRVVMVGLFDRHDGRTRKYVTRILPDCTIDTTFVPPDVNGGWIKTVAVQSDGKVLIGGNFNLVGGASRSGIARLNADGSLDGTFTVGTGFLAGTNTGDVRDIRLQPDGKLFCSGNFNSYNGATTSLLVRLNTDGTLDGTFNTGTGFNASIFDLKLQPDGKLLVAGWFTTYNGTSRAGVARLGTTGTLDATFAPTLTGGTQCYAVDLRPDGKVWLMGNFSSVNGQARDNFVLLTSTGATDASFVPAATNDFVNSIAGQADGKLLVGKHINSPNGSAQDFLSRFNADGSLDAAFVPPDVNSIVNHVMVLPDQRIMVFGSFTAYGKAGESTFTRLMPDGTVDPTLVQANAFDLGVTSTLRQPDGKYICTGAFYSYFNRTANQVARLHPNGQLDTTFNAWWGINGAVMDAALQPDGKVIIGGYFVDPYDTTYSSRLMRLNADGSRDPSFTVDWTSMPSGERIELQPDGKVLVATSQSLYRRLANGDPDPAFTIGSTNSVIFDILYVPGGDIMVAAGGSTWNGAAVGRVFRLNSDGSLDPGFSGGNGMGSSGVFDMERQADGKLLLAGSFTSYDGNTAMRLARVNANGTFDATFNVGAGFDNNIELVRIAPNGKIIVSGSFLNVQGVPRSRLARLNSDGSIDTGFVPGAGPQYYLADVEFDANSDMIAVGGFTWYNGVGRNRVARIFGGLSTTSVTVGAKAILEGPFDSGTLLMNDALRSSGLIPTTEPYTALGFVNTGGGGGETTSAGVLAVTGTNAIVDWVRIELRNAIDPTVVVASRQCLLQRDGDVVSAADGSSPVSLNAGAGSYYVVIRHRNHLGCMTAASVALTGTATTIDFRANATLTYGTDARKSIVTQRALWAGNTVRDTPAPFKLKYTGATNDRDPILSAIGGTVPTNTITGYRVEDCNMDGTVKYTGTANDRDIILSNIGSTIPTNTRVEQVP